MMSTRAFPSVGQLAVQLLIGVDQQENIRADSHRVDSPLVAGYHILTDFALEI